MRFGYGQFGRYGQRAARIGQDRKCIRLPESISVPFFQRRPGSYWAKQRPGSDLDGLVRVWPNTFGLETSWCTGIIGPGFWQDATGPLTVSHFQTRFRSSPTSRIILCKSSPDPIWFWLIASGFGQTDPVRKQAICARIIRPLLANASQPIRTEWIGHCLLGFSGQSATSRLHICIGTTYLPLLARSCNNNNNNNINNNGNL